jgi:hypothetical protein
MIERQSKMVSHRKDTFLAWIAFFQEERPSSGFARASSASTPPFSSSASIGTEIVLSDWCLEQVSSIPSVDKMLFGLPVSFGVGSVRRKHLNIDAPIVNTGGNESPSASRRAVAHQLQQLSPGSPSLESAQTASCRFGEIALTERSTFNVVKGVLLSFPSSNDPQELEVTKIILRYLLENLTEVEVGVVADTLQELSHFGLTDSYIDSFSLLFHWNR